MKGCVSLVTLLACGSRTDIDLLRPGGLDARVDASVVPEGGVAPLPPTCPSWTATAAPAQVSSIASIVDVETAVAVPTGVLVGYADIQFPPVDPNWHGRVVSFGDAALGPEQTYFTRAGGSVGWTAISFAQGFGRAAAAAADTSDGALFAGIDPTGDPSGSVAHVGTGEVKHLLATPGGFTALTSPFSLDDSGDNPGPVSIATLDGAGNLQASTVLVSATPALQYYTRVAYSDGTFALLWTTQSASETVILQHFSSTGSPLAQPKTLQPPGANGFALTAAPTSTGLLLVSTDGTGMKLLASPFDRDGNQQGVATMFAEASSSVDEFALAGAPGGDVLVAWFDSGAGTGGETQVRVISVAASGSPEGPATTIASTMAAENSSLVAVAAPGGAMVFYDDEAQGSIEVFAVPLKCSSF